jgi:hypothetical protein
MRVLEQIRTFFLCESVALCTVRTAFVLHIVVLHAAI